MVHRGAWSAEMKAKLDHIENTILEAFYNYTKAHDEYQFQRLSNVLWKKRYIVSSNQATTQTLKTTGSVT